MKASDTIFSKNANVRKTVRVPIIFLFDLLERPIGVPLYVALLFTGLELNHGSRTLPSMEQTNVDVATTSSRFNGDFPAFALSLGLVTGGTSDPAD